MKNLSPGFQHAIDIAVEAGESIMPYFKAEDVKHRIKPDGSDATIADDTSSELIIRRLGKIDPGIPVLSEENLTDFSTEYKKIPGKCWIVDPLDGTLIFLQGQTGFMVLMAYLENQKPVKAVAHFPARGETYFAEAGSGAFKIEKNGIIRELKREATLNKSKPLRQIHTKLYDDDICTEIGESFALASGYPNVLVLDSPDSPHLSLGVADGSSDFCVRYLNKSYRDKKAGGGIWDHAAIDLILSEANCFHGDDLGRPFFYENPNAILQTALTLAPGLDKAKIVQIFRQKLLEQGLPAPIR